MIYLAITAEGLLDAIQVAAPDDTIWCGTDAITEDDYERLVGVNLTRFVYELGDRSRLDSALATIDEHHPGQRIWVEAPKPGR